MTIYKTQILKNICYTALVYQRINKKLQTNFSKKEIEAFIFETIEKTEIDHFEKIGKNFYISNLDKKIRVTVNSNTYSIITVDRIKG